MLNSVWVAMWRADKECSFVLMEHSVELEKGWELSEIIEGTREFLITKTGTFFQLCQH